MIGYDWIYFGGLFLALVALIIVIRHVIELQKFKPKTKVTGADVAPSKTVDATSLAPVKPVNISETVKELATKMSSEIETGKLAQMIQTAEVYLKSEPIKIKAFDGLRPFSIAFSATMGFLFAQVVFALFIFIIIMLFHLWPVIYYYLNNPTR